VATLELFRNDNPDARVSAQAQYIICLVNPIPHVDGTHLLTARCASLQELDTEIDAIKAKLDQIGKDAHQRWGA
jgi:hypothetical protein